jgi:hypothetical protein
MVLGTTSVVAYSIFRDYYLRAVARFVLRDVLRVFLAEDLLVLRADLRAFLAIISSLFAYVGL